MTKTYWIVEQGIVRPATVDDDVDWINSVFTAAYDETEALKLAQAYDDGQIQPDNFWDPDRSQAVVALCVIGE